MTDASTNLAFERVTNFDPVMTIDRTPDLEKLDRDDLISLLPKSMQREIKRIEDVFDNMDILTRGKNLVFPYNGRPIKGWKFDKSDILLMFDPPKQSFSDIPEETVSTHRVYADPVLWSRVYLGINPRVYQIVLLRNPHPRKVLRLGRRCGKTTTIALRMLWKSYTDAGNKSLLIAPMRSHVGVTWEMLNKFINESPELAHVRAKKGFRAIEQPHHLMEFPNGSTIKCFTSGVRSASHADSVRGQEADDIYIDEVDLMSAEDFPAFISILRDTGRRDNQGKKRDKSMIVATTPNGRRDMLWKFVTEYHVNNVRGTEMEDRGFIDYYFPTHADLNYTPADDAEAFMMLDYNGYLHEVIADFGEEASGVFLKEQIERALGHFPDGYDYHNMGKLYQRRNGFEKVVVGVDWDKFGAGTNIVVCGIDYRPVGTIDDTTGLVDPFAGRVRIIYRVEVARSMTTLHDGLEMIKNMNVIFNPDKFYIDRGYGESQVEDLFLSQREGDPRTKGLWDKVRPVAFNEAVEIYDPITKLPLRRELKDHMVTQTVKWFEKDRIVLNDNDYDQVPGLSDILKQFEQYLQIGISILGKPRYEAGSVQVGDHALDAFMLCVLAAEQEWGDFAMPNFNIHPTSVKMNMSSSKHIMKMGKESSDDFDEDDVRKAHITRSDIKVSRPNLRKGRRRLSRTRL